MREKQGPELEKVGRPEGPRTDRQPSGPDWRFSAEVAGAVAAPPVGPLSLWLRPPISDVGEILAVFGWPLLYFLGGLFASYFDQPRYEDGQADDALTKLKRTAHDLRVAWLFFLLLFEGLAPMWILSGYQGTLLPFVLVAYATYGLLVVLWLVWTKRIREHQRRG